MTEKAFLHDLRRGLGSAIIELQENPDRAQYHNIVLKCCLKDIGYDVQSEGTKGYYLYTAICTLGAMDEFEDVLIGTFNKRLKQRLFQQLADILCMYTDNGSLKSENALSEKYQYFVERLPKQRAFPFQYCEREQFEYLMIWQVDAGRWPAFKKCIHDAGAIMAARRDDVCSCYDWFLYHCENLFGKRKVWRYLEAASATSETVKAFVGAHREFERARAENSRIRIEPEVTLESYIARARALENDQYAYARMRFAAMHFSKQASPDDLIELASHVTKEPSNGVRANMLRVFRDIDFPGDIKQLINYAHSDCERLRDIAIDSLGRFKDERVHDLAITLLTEGNPDVGLLLLINNWHKSDEPLIRQQVLSTKKVSHTIQQNLRDIYKKRRSNFCGDILEHIYRNAECTYCRLGIVEDMVKNHVLRENILRECRLDSYDDTRELAERIIRKQTIK